MRKRTAQVQYVNSENYYLVYLSETEFVWMGVASYKFNPQVIILNNPEVDPFGFRFDIFDTEYTGCSFLPKVKLGYIFFPYRYGDDDKFENFLQNMWEGSIYDDVLVAEMAPGEPDIICMNVEVFTALNQRIKQEQNVKPEPNLTNEV